eukprot:362675-Chlamydomonas_euryale.AAC.5
MPGHGGRGARARGMCEEKVDWTPGRMNKQGGSQCGGGARARGMCEEERVEWTPERMNKHGGQGSYVPDTCPICQSPNLQLTRPAI